MCQIRWISQKSDFSSASAMYVPGWLKTRLFGVSLHSLIIGILSFSSESAFGKKDQLFLFFFFFSHCHKESHSSVQLQQQRKEQAESFWGSSYLRSKSVLGYDPDYSKNELCSSSPVLRCFRRTWPWNTAACFAAVHRYSNAQEIKKSTRVFSLWVVQNPELASTCFWRGLLSGGVFVLPL